MNSFKSKRRVALTLIIVMMTGLFPPGFTAFAADFADRNYLIGPAERGYVNSDLGFPTDTYDGDTREHFTFYLGDDPLYKDNSGSTFNVPYLINNDVIKLRVDGTYQEICNGNQNETETDWAMVYNTSTRKGSLIYLGADQIPDGEYEITIDASKLFYFDGTDYEPYDDEVQVTITVDRTAPKVEGITGSIKEGIKIRFSEEIDPSTLSVTFRDTANTQTYRLSDLTAIWDGDYAGVLLTPGSDIVLQNDTSYTITVTAGEDIAGNRLVEATAETFAYSDIAGLMATILVKDGVNGTVDHLHPEIAVNFNNTVPYLNNGMVNDPAMLEPSNEFIFLHTPSGSKVPCDYTVSADFYTVTLTPKNPLIRGEAYTVVVRDLTNAQGDPMTRRTESFTVLKAAPVISITPAADSVQTSLNEIAINFSEEVFRVNGASLSQAYMASNITVNCNGAAVSVNYIYNSGKITATLTSGNFPEGNYSVTVKDNAFYDAYGNGAAGMTSYFSISTGDFGAGFTGIENGGKYQSSAVDNGITLSFSKDAVYAGDGSTPVTPNTVAAALTLTDGNNGVHNINVSQVDGRTFRVAPAASLASGTYTLTLRAGQIKDANQISNPAVSISFAVDMDAPSILSSLPGNGETVVNTAPDQIVVVFDEPVFYNGKTIRSLSEAEIHGIVNIAGVNSSEYTVAALQNNTVVISLANPLANNSYTVTFDGLHDNAGNNMNPADGTFTFTVEVDTVAPIVLITPNSLTNKSKPEITISINKTEVRYKGVHFNAATLNDVIYLTDSAGLRIPTSNYRITGPNNNTHVTFQSENQLSDGIYYVVIDGEHITYGAEERILGFKNQIFEIDGTPPSAFILPANGAVITEDLSNVLVSFSETVFDASGNGIVDWSGVIQVADGNDVPVPGTWSYSNSKMQVTFVPVSPMGNGAYTITVHDVVYDRAGNVLAPLASQFTVQKEMSAELEAAIVIENIDENNKTEQLYPEIQVNFNNTAPYLNGGLLTAGMLEPSNNYIFLRSASGSKIACSYTVSEDYYTVTLVPQNALIKGETYSVVVTGLTNSDGIVMTRISKSFAVSKEGPIPYITPVDGSVQTVLDQITVNFEEEVTQANGNPLDSSYMASNIAVTRSGLPIAADYIYADSRVVILPVTGTFAEGNYSVTVNSNAFYDAYGNAAKGAASRFAVSTGIFGTGFTGIENGGTYRAAVIDNGITLSFSKDVYAASGSDLAAPADASDIAAALTLVDAGNKPYTITVDKVDSRTFTVKPYSTLSSGIYTLTLREGQLEDANQASNPAADIVFMIDNDAPYILSSIPASGETITNTAPNQIVVVFNEPVFYQEKGIRSLTQSEINGIVSISGVNSGDYMVHALKNDTIVIVPNETLKNGVYTVTFNGLHDRVGNAMDAAGGDFAFTVDIDTTAPIVLITPNSLTNKSRPEITVSINKTEVLYKGEHFNAGTLNDVIYLTDSAGMRVPTSNYRITGPSSNTLVTFEADNQLPDGIYYVVIDGEHITYGTEERILGFKNQIFEIDATDPAIFVTPVNNAIVSYTLGQVIIQFSEAVFNESGNEVLDWSNIISITDGRGAEVPGSFQYRSGNLRVIFSPDSGSFGNGSYTVTVDKVYDRAGNSSALTSSFSVDLTESLVRFYPAQDARVNKEEASTLSPTITFNGTVMQNGVILTNLDIWSSYITIEKNNEQINSSEAASVRHENGKTIVSLDTGVIPLPDGEYTIRVKENDFTLGNGNAVGTHWATFIVKTSEPYILSASPRDGAAALAPDTAFTYLFSEALYYSDGNPLTANHVLAFAELRDGNDNPVKFTIDDFALIDGHTQFTIVPSQRLANGMYTLKFNEDYAKDWIGNYFAGQTFTYYVAQNSAYLTVHYDDEGQWTELNNTKHVLRFNSKIAVGFEGSAVVKADGTEITASDFNTLFEVSPEMNGKFTVGYEDDKFYLTFREALSKGDYSIILKDGAVKSDSNSLASQVVTFHVIDSLFYVTFEPTHGSRLGALSEIKITFNPPGGEVYVSNARLTETNVRALVKEYITIYNGTNPVEYNAAYDESSKTLTLVRSNGFNYANGDYSVTIAGDAFHDIDGNMLDRQLNQFTIAVPQPAFYPADGASASNKIDTFLISFDENLYRYDNGRELANVVDTEFLKRLVDISYNDGSGTVDYTDFTVSVSMDRNSGKLFIYLKTDENNYPSGEYTVTFNGSLVKDMADTQLEESQARFVLLDTPITWFTPGSGTIADWNEEIVFEFSSQPYTDSNGQRQLTQADLDGLFSATKDDSLFEDFETQLISGTAVKIKPLVEWESGTYIFKYTGDHYDGAGIAFEKSSAEYKMVFPAKPILTFVPAPGTYENLTSFTVVSSETVNVDTADFITITEADTPVTGYSVTLESDKKTITIAGIAFEEGKTYKVTAYGQYAKTVDGNRTAADVTVEYTIGVKAAGLSVSPATRSIAAGNTFTVTASVTPADTANPNVSWSSSDDTVASVDTKGLVSALSEGTAVITATTTDGSDLSAACTVTVTAAGGNGNGGGGGTGTTAGAAYTVTFETSGGSEIAAQKVTSGKTASEPKDPIKDGDIFTGWYTNKDCTEEYDFDKAVTANITLYAGWEEGILHEPYINGYTDGTFRPASSITRAETAQMFYNLADQSRRITSQSFTDVNENDWYYDAVQYLAGIGVVAGYEDGSFGSDQPITRAEFTAMVVRYSELTSGGTPSFPDAHGHWATGYIAAAEQAGYVSGYPDGSFGPETDISRAETVTALNRMLGRTADANYNAAQNMLFNDVPRSSWAWDEIAEAAVRHIH